MYQSIKKSAVIIGLVGAPAIASAQNLTAITTLISALVNYGIAIMIGLTILGFFWGLFKYLKAGVSSEDKKKGASYMIQGVIALAVMLSIYGLVRVLQSSFLGSANNAPIAAPTIGDIGIGQGIRY